VKRVAAVVVLAVLGIAPVRGAAAAPAAKAACASRVLVLSAFPAELDAVLARAQFRSRRAITVEGRTFYPGRLGRHSVLMAMTGIGPANAQATTELAFRHFRCDGAAAISAVVFSGVAGSYRYIGDVMVPVRWSGDGGKTWTATDPGMLAAAREVAAARTSLLVQDSSPVGDPACACPLAADGKVTPVHLAHKPEVVVGGDGYTSDPFGGRTFPCVPGGGDVFGCRPCRGGRIDRPRAAVSFLTGIIPFIPNFFLEYIAAPEPSGTGAAAADEESAAVALVAAAQRRPFIAFRSVSDGQGDPLMLPGFPFQFFAYRQISAFNAAAATAAFLQRWA